MEGVLGQGGEELVLGRALEIDVDGEEVVLRVVELLEPSLEMVLQRGLADAALAVEQQAVVVHRLQDAVDQAVAADEEVLVEHRSAAT